MMETTANGAGGKDAAGCAPAEPWGVAMSSVLGPGPEFSLRVFRGDDPPGDRPRCAPGRDTVPTLAQFFDDWFAPVVLIGARDASPAALKPYREALVRWKEAVGDLPIDQIDALAVARAQAFLRSATYRRGPLSAERPVRPPTVRKWQRCLRAILRRLGPTNPWAPDEVCAGVLPFAPSLTVDDPPRRRPIPKPAYTLDEARRIVAACDSILGRRWRTRPGRRSAIALDGADPTSPAWWRAWFAVLFYTGLRSGTVLQLRREHCQRDAAGGWWLDVPEALVAKTEKRLRLRLHPKAVEALDAIRPSPLAGWRSAAWLLPWNRDYSHLVDVAASIATAAGVARLSPHAWRRTFGRMVGRPALDAMNRAARALDHADAATTAASYVDPAEVEADLILSLPDLW